MKELKRLLLIVFCLMSVGLMSAKTAYFSCITAPDIHTLRVRWADGSVLERPILELNDERQLEISFDELSHNTHLYTYRLLHLNADNTESDLQSGEYVEGFTTADITDYDYSVNTQQLYTHYSFTFPNNDMLPKVSGNYAIQIYEDGDVNKTIAIVCFSVVEPLAGIECAVRSNTSKELSGRYQQLDIDVSLENLEIVNPAQEVKLVVKQNNRQDNAVMGVAPTYIEGHKLRYINKKELIFEGGNEFRHFDIGSQYVLGYNVDKIYFDHRQYHAFLFQDERLNERAYTTQSDANGQFVINAERSSDDDYEADYMWVHFLLEADKPFFDGILYVGGDLTYNLTNTDNRMDYDDEHKAYTGALYLKQGGYDYQYRLKKKNEKQCSLERTEGSFWQAHNEYTIYIYFRPFGSRADRLVGVEVIRN